MKKFTATAYLRKISINKNIYIISTKKTNLFCVLESDSMVYVTFLYDFVVCVIFVKF